MTNKDPKSEHIAEPRPASAPGDLPQAVVDLSTPAASSAPGMPNDRDETVGMTGGIPDERVQQAHVDLQHGLKDTSRAEATDEAYRRQKQGN
jgi:hypothetical protein